MEDPTRARGAFAPGARSSPFPHSLLPLYHVDVRSVLQRFGDESVDCAEANSVPLSNIAITTEIEPNTSLIRQ
jgi:hypothetical protein